MRVATNGLLSLNLGTRRTIKYKYRHQGHVEDLVKICIQQCKLCVLGLTWVVVLFIDPATAGSNENM